MDTKPTDFLENWTLTFADHFEGTELDETKWRRDPEAPRRDGFWADEDAYLDGEGHLVIQVREEEGKFYSGAINSQETFNQAYGYFEIRAHVPVEEGFWMAYWLTAPGVHVVGDEGRTGTEIDIFESPFSRDGKIEHALHWGGYQEHHQSVGVTIEVPEAYDGFSTYAVEWNEDEYIFYINGQETWRTSAGGVSQVPSFMRITAEVGDWGGDITKADLPSRMLVDYVKVYKRK